MKVMIDAYNLALTKGTGVATYARNLSRSLKDMGHEVSVLYDVPMAKTQNEFLKEVLFFDHPDARMLAGASFDHFFTRLKSVVATATGHVSPDYIPVKGQVLSQHIESRLPSYDHIYNAPHLYYASLVYFRVTGRFITIKLDDPPDIAHWTYPLPLRIAGARNIYTIHDLVPLKLPFTTLDDKQSYLGLCQKIVATADAVVTVSENSKRDICTLLGAQSSLVHNTYQSVSFPEKFTSSSRHELTNLLNNMYGLKRGEYFLYLGAIEPKKNVGRLLEAFLGSDSTFPLVMVGSDAWLAENELSSWDQELTSHFSIQGEKILKSRRVIRLDYVAFANVISLIRGARALLFPSLYEGFGLPVLEAMTLGTPVLTSDNGSLGEISHGAALQVDPYDTQAIRHGINNLLIGSDLASMSEKGLTRAKNFSPTVVNQRLNAVYQSLAH
ncbi:glycosyltransferase family 1 protein [Halioglobus maricola]|uniref:Glycosyltransferase family 1 protein n=1 Tax=Halioglobus maricola TaxID=2601894 RepID=A0A5P9NF55_9GAMM|nr:glycosyltransferase family 1 protein [Halioglobus maricola]QFU74407.1 glycosyltransferase family 1 protein [Halioglobus maricola]